MSNATLCALGIPPIDANTEPRAYAAVSSVARRVRSAGRSVIGFVPAEPRVAVPPLLIQLALALHELAGARVALVDANARFPAFRDVVPAQSENHALLAVRLHASVELVMAGLARERPFGEREFEQLIAKSRERFHYVLVDLTGSDRHHLPGFPCVDAAVVVAHARSTREYELVLAARRVPRERLLGVLLVGG